MMHYDWNDVSEGIDVDKTSASKECDICYHWTFLDKAFKFQPYACNWCHDMSMLSMNPDDIALLNICGTDYFCIIDRINKIEPISLQQNVNLNKKWGSL